MTEKIIEYINKKNKGREYWIPVNDLDDIIKYYYLKLGWCICGIPGDALAVVGKFLEAHKDFDERQKRLKKAFGVKSIYDNGLLLCLAYEMDRAEFTEHGTSVGGAWLTEDGEYFLWAIQEAEKDGPITVI